MEFVTLMQLLEPIAPRWQNLGYYLVADHTVDTIEADCLNNKDSKDALSDAIKKWLSCTVRAKRTWQTLLIIAEKWGDKTLRQFLNDNKFSGKSIYSSQITCAMLTMYYQTCLCDPITQIHFNFNNSTMQRLLTSELLTVVSYPDHTRVPVNRVRLHSPF